MLPHRIAVSLSRLSHEIAHINTWGLARSQRFPHAGMQKHPNGPREQRARTDDAQVRPCNCLEHSRMSRHWWLEEESHNRCLWLTPHDLPFPNDAPSVLQLSTNVGHTIRDRENPLPQACRLAHIFHCSI